MATRFRIHPGFGVARVGNSPQGFFIGPEHPEIPANWENGAFASFRDGALVKRQAVRFRVFEYDEDAQGGLANPREVQLGGRVVKIEWRVHIANKKASFFTFSGQFGADDTYKTRSQTPATQAIPGSDPPIKNLRNPTVAQANRASLNIDPGEQMISTETGGVVPLTNPNAAIPVVKTLGELRLDGARLIFLGGHGDSGSTAKPTVKIVEYANNDTWFDDMSDGSVKARVFLDDNTRQDADAAWVSVGPPDFAPGIGNVVTLLDTMWDLAAHELPLPNHECFRVGPFARLTEHKQDPSLANYRPSFLQEVYPLLERAFGAFWTFEAKENNQSLHLSFKDYARLATPAGTPDGERGKLLRDLVLSRLRNPDDTAVNWKGMPRGLGDFYDDIDDKGGATAKSFLSLSRIQYGILRQWATERFEADWPNAVPAIPDPPAVVTPEDLDAAALVNAVGGPFYPGIDVSWLIRQKELYAEPFRMKVPTKPESEAGGISTLTIGALTFGPGFFSQQMALPWQADFYDCHKEEHRGPEGLMTFMWWTAHRPDSVLPTTTTVPADARVRWVRAFDAASTKPDPDDLDNFARFSEMQQKWSQLKFIVGDRNLFKEEA